MVRMNGTTSKLFHKAILLPAMVLALVAPAGRPAIAQTSPHGPIKFACEECHTAESWSIMPSPSKFKHERTGFPLTGQHSVVECTQCHASLSFTGTKQRCMECHQDVHRNELGATCERCHTTQSWLVPDMIERHNMTRFALVGAHRVANCRQCHVNQQQNEFVGLRTDCVGCHQADYDATKTPVHRSAGFGLDCATCHSVSSLSWGSDFDHSRTGFPLTGAHAATACSQCHANNVFTGASPVCYSCHQAQFASAVNPSHAGFPTDCAACHTTWAWRPAAFDHNATAFPLTGAHVTVACTDCHKNNVYKGTPTGCYSCHQSQFTSAATPSHAGFSTDCVACHTTAAWRPASFDHSKTSFPLTGAHAAVACASCHKNNVYAGLPTDCYSCHAADFAGAASPPHAGFPTTCATCHTTTAWSPASFDHSATAFPLTGAHTSTPCASCHVNNVYKGTPATCGASACHLPNYNATKPSHASGGFGIDCQTCHTTTAWLPYTWSLSNHAAWFRIASGNKHNPTVWANDCATCHVTASYLDFVCIDCHTHNKATTDQQHQGRANYQYTSAACYSCHKGA
jgi:hypothetical protein